MKVKDLTLELKGVEYFKRNISLIAGIKGVHLSPKESEFLARFLEIGGSFSTSNRKLVRESMNLSIPNMSNYIRFLTKKGILIKNSEGIIFNKNVIPNKKYQGYRILLKNT